MSFAFHGIDHIQLVAPPGSEQAARHFYGELLGWTELPKPEALQARGGVWFQCGTQEVHIGIQSDFVPAAKAHPAFIVSGLDALRTRLLAHGVTIEDDTARMVEGIARWYVYDPFGNRLECMERIADGSGSV